MTDGSESQTSTTLIERLQADGADPRAWEEFDRRYRPTVLAWCRAWGVQAFDAEDVAQAVLLKLVSVIRQYRRQPDQKFRSWLRVVTQRVWLDLAPPRTFVGGEAGRLLIERAEARADLDRQLAEQFDSERLEAAFATVKARVNATTWEAFRLMALEGLTGPAVSERLGMPVAHVYVAKHRVQKQLRAVLKEPDDDETTDFPLRRRIDRPE
jgi:RNA polymerase sigma-70 factor (ECF subfamily)